MTRPEDSVGEEALALAAELQDRVRRERATVRALKEHLLTVERGGDAVCRGDGSEQLGPGLHAHRCDEPPRMRLTLCGELDLSGAVRLRHLLSDAVAAGYSQIELDLERVTFMDSHGLGVLLNARRQCAAVDGAVLVLRAHPSVRRLLRVTRLDHLLLGAGTPLIPRRTPPSDQ